MRIDEFRSTAEYRQRNRGHASCRCCDEINLHVNDDEMDILLVLRGGGKFAASAAAAMAP
ncbi:MAG: hypothetical protein R3E31_04345 [Chloroflexota bacterium]